MKAGRGVSGRCQRRIVGRGDGGGGAAGIHSLTLVATSVSEWVWEYVAVDGRQLGACRTEHSGTAGATGGWIPSDAGSGDLEDAAEFVDRAGGHRHDRTQRPGEQ